MTAALAYVTLLRTICAIPWAYDLYLSLLVALGVVGEALVILVIAGRFVFSRKPRLAVSLAAAVVAPIVLWTQIVWVSDCLHLAGSIALSPSRPDAKGFRTFDWSAGLAGDPDVLMIHDARPSAAQLEPSVANHVDGECGGSATRLIGRNFFCIVE